MEDPFASLTGNSEPNQPLQPSQKKSTSPFDELVENSRSRRVRKRTIYSLVFAGLLLIGFILVPRILSGDVAPTASEPNPVAVASADASNEPEEIPSNSTEESPETAFTDSEEQDLYAPPLDLESFIQEITGSTVIIECAASADAEYVDAGSGFVIDVSDLTGDPASELAIVTNHHVVEVCADGGGVLFVGQGDEFSEVKVLGYDIANDLALVGLGSLDVDSLSISSDISVGQWVMTSGSPVGIESNVTFGQVTSTSTLSETGGSEQIASDAVIGPGNSGGPLVNSSGEAIGVNSAVFIDATGISVSVPVTYLCISILSCPN